MKPFFTAAFLIFCFSALAQNATRTVYLIVRVEDAYDAPNDRRFWKLLPERSSPYASEIYSIIPYNTMRKAINKTGNFYPAVQDSALPYYNYFKDRTQALQFMADHGWELQTIDTEISSDWKKEATYDHLYTDIKSRPVYYFRKTIPHESAAN